MNYLCFICLFLANFVSFQLYSQYPAYFLYDDENGLPTNEVYSILQDQKGFIWIGTSLGLYKFDGIQFHYFKSQSQNSKSISNLCLAYDGTIFCSNFENQIFFIDSTYQLQELPHDLQGISNITTDAYNLYVTHKQGISYYNLKNFQWIHVQDFQYEGNLFTRSVIVNENHEIFFLSDSSIRKLDFHQSNVITQYDFEESLASYYLITSYKQKVWLFSRKDDNYYTIQNGFVQRKPSIKLSYALKNQKINRAKALKDNLLWINTYQGTIIYDEKYDSVQILYPDFAFSDVILDDEGNYWFTTLENGILRVPNLRFLVWNEKNENIKNQKILKLVSDNHNIYFATARGFIGQFNLTNQEIKSFHTQIYADIENLSFDSYDQKLYFSLQNNIFSLKNYQIHKENFQCNALKSFLHVPPFYFMGSSTGLFIENQKKTVKIHDYWCREIIQEYPKNSIWVATNKGILNFHLINNQWVCKDTLQKNTQILSLAYESNSSTLYFVTFDGKIYAYSINQSKLILLFKIPEKYKANKIRFYNHTIYLATNQGLLVYKNQKLENLTTFNGLASNNIQDLLIVNQDLWLATGKGLQKIPLNYERKIPLSKVYLKNYQDKVSLHYDEVLILYPEVVSYSSNGNFQYAYQVQNQEWIQLPANISKIELQNLPYGLWNLKLKAIDFLGRDSENTILISVEVFPPFWATWWFRIWVLIIISLVTFWIVRKIIQTIEKRKNIKIELLNSQLKAIRAQMNPHFLYNTLNSIQDLILQQDIKSTNYYLSKFSNLMRQILAFSEEEKVLIADEIEMLQNYLELEKLRFGNDFQFSIEVDKNIDTQRVYIPSLMIQPYVENAIKHGLLHKKGLKKLVIHFQKLQNIIIITIEDNGIGRKKSEEIQKRSGWKHKSFASQALQKRMELLSKSHTQKIHLEIQDVFKESEVAGTKVIIQLEEIS